MVLIYSRKFMIEFGNHIRKTTPQSTYLVEHSLLSERISHKMMKLTEKRIITYVQRRLGKKEHFSNGVTLLES